jgi:hypothetical protein
LGPIAGGVEPGVPEGASDGVPLGPIAGAKDPGAPDGARICWPSGPTSSVDGSGVVSPSAGIPVVAGNPLGPMGGSIVGGSAETARAVSLGGAARKAPVEDPFEFSVRGGEYPPSYAGFLGS